MTELPGPLLNPVTHQEAHFFRLALDLFCMFDRDGVIRRINPAVSEILGYAGEDVVGRHFFEFLHPDDRQPAGANLQEMLDGHDVVCFECRCVVKGGGRYRWVSWTCRSPEPGEELLYAIGRDVTERRELEQALAEWQDRHQVASRVTGGVVYEWDTEADRFYWGDNFQSVLGYPRPEAPAGLAAWLALVHPDDRGRVEAAARRAASGRSALHLEYRVRRRGGDYLHARDDAEFFRDAAGRRVRMVGYITDVTGQRRAEEQSRELIESSPTGIVLVDGGGRVVSANPQAAAWFGYGEGELVGEPIELLLPERLRPAHVAARDAYLRDPVPKPMAGRGDLVARRKGGEEFPVAVGLHPIPTGDGSVRIACTVLDLSQQVRDRQALWNSERRLRDMIDNTSAVVYVKDLGGKYLLINRQFETLFGRTSDQAQGLTDFDIFPAEAAEGFRRNDRVVAETGRVLRIEEVAPHADGPHNYISVKFPLRDAASGEVYAVAGISTDITELVAARRDLQQLTQQLERILGAAADGIYGIGLDGRTTFANPAAERMLGWKAEELVGTVQHSYTHHRRADGTPYPLAECRIHAAMRDGQVHRADDEVFFRKDGSSFPVEYVSSPLEEGGRITGAVVAFRDITERQERAAREKELHAARRVQQKLYPAHAPHPPGFDIAGASYPAAAVCGDYFDFVPLSDRLLAVAVGDVSGHGLPAALHMVQTRADVRALLAAETDLVAVLARLNLLLLRDTPDETFVTLFLALLDTRDRALVYAGAGHEARLLRPGGRARRLKSTGLILGVEPRARYRASRPIPLAAGDTLLVVTDGVAEAESPPGPAGEAATDVFGIDRAIAVVRDHRHLPAAAIIATLYQSVCDFAGNRPLNDDLTTVVVRVL